MTTAGCVGFQPRVETVTAPAIDVATAWTDAIAPQRPVRLVVRWRLQSPAGRMTGRGVVRFVPPDSLRFDYRAPFGRRGAAVLAGDRMLWSHPSDAFTRIAPVIALFRAALGIPATPPPGAEVFAQGPSPSRVWRYETGDTTLVFSHVTHRTISMLTAMMTRNGYPVGTSFAAIADSTGLVVRSRMWFPATSQVFTATALSADTLWVPDPQVWQHGRPPPTDLTTETSR